MCIQGSLSVVAEGTRLEGDGGRESRRDAPVGIASQVLPYVGDEGQLLGGVVDG